MKYTESRLRMGDGYTLLVRLYESAETRASRTLIIVHGACEHGQRYDRVARFMVHCGWNVIVADQRGHGLSDGEHTHIDDFHQYVRDLQTIFEHYQCDPGRTALLGHSMGGLVSVRFAQALQGQVAALVLLSPLLAIKVEIPWFLRAVDRVLGRLLSIVLPKLRFHSRIDASCTTRCRRVLEQKRHDKLLRNSVTIGWYLAVQRTLKKAWKESSQLNLPLLVIQSEQDCIVDPAAPPKWIAQVPTADRTLRYVPGALHELFSEPDWEEIAIYITRWLERRVPRHATSMGEVQCETQGQSQGRGSRRDSRLESQMTGTITPPSWIRTLSPSNKTSASALH